jgi:hypothetical protein
MPYAVGTGSKLFAATAAGVFDISAGGSVGAAMFAATSGRWSHTQFATSAVDALVMVNGHDAMRQWYSGSWTTVATVGTGPSDLYDTDTFNLVCAYRQRLFFGIKGTLNFVYLPAGSIAGATAARFQLNQLFPRGGVLAAIDTWSVDSGTGPDDYIAFLSTEGEAVIFRGSDPSDATKWSLTGVYYIGPPLGNRCTAKIAGDLWVMTKTGIVSLTRVMRSGRVSAKELISYPFQPTYESAVKESLTSDDWTLVPFLDQGIVLAPYSLPVTTGAQFVFQTGSGGWSRFTGWPGRSWTVWNGQLYYGGANSVCIAMTGTSDLGAWIEGRAFTAYNFLNARSRRKHIKLVRPVFATDVRFEFQMGLVADYALPGYSSSIGGETTQAGIWDTSTWDNAFWGGGAIVQQQWRNVSNKDGFCHALALRVRTKTARPSLLSIDYLFEPAGLF